MIEPINKDIQDKPVLTKVANILTVVYDMDESNSVTINAWIYSLVLPPQGVMEEVKKNPVFLDTFVVNENDLPGSGPLNDRVVLYVCNIWGLTLK